VIGFPHMHGGCAYQKSHVLHGFQSDRTSVLIASFVHGCVLELVSVHF